MMMKFVILSNFWFVNILDFSFFLFLFVTIFLIIHLYIHHFYYVLLLYIYWQHFFKILKKKVELFGFNGLCISSVSKGRQREKTRFKVIPLLTYSCVSLISRIRRSSFYPSSLSRVRTTKVAVPLFCRNGAVRRDTCWL